MQTMYSGVVNSPSTALTSAIDGIQTTITVNDASKLPAAPNIAVIGKSDDAETILYTGKSGNDLTGVTRGFQGTAKNWNLGINVARFFTNYDYSALTQNVQEIKDDVDAHKAENVHVGYAADAEATDAYKIILSVRPTAYVDIIGKLIIFKANTANTGACTLALQKNDGTWLANVSIKKNVSANTATGDILAGQDVFVVYDGTNFQMLPLNSMPLAGGGFTGTVYFSGNEAIQPKLRYYSETVYVIAAATGAVDIDISNGNVFDITLSGNTTFSFSTPSPSGPAFSITLILRQGGTSRTVTWPASVKWSNDTIPDVSDINKTAILTFVTINGGTRWYGFLAGNKLVT